LKRSAPSAARMLRRYSLAVAASVAHAALELILSAALAAWILLALAYLAVRWVVRGVVDWARALWAATVAVMGS